MNFPGKPWFSTGASLLCNRIVVGFFFININLHYVQVRVCREKTTGHVYAMKKLKKSEMLRRGQVFIQLACLWYYGFLIIVISN